MADWHSFDDLDEPGLHALRKRIERQRDAVECFAPLLRRRRRERYLAALAAACIYGINRLHHSRRPVMNVNPSTTPIAEAAAPQTAATEPAPAMPPAAPGDTTGPAAALPAAADAVARADGTEKPARKSAGKSTAKPAVTTTRRAAAPKVRASGKRAAQPAVKPAKPPKNERPASTAKAEAAPAVAAKPPRVKEKLVRDSFTMPRGDFALIHQLKERGLGFKREVRKSELLRAGLQVLSAMDDAALKALLDRLPKIKTGRPRKTG